MHIYTWVYWIWTYLTVIQTTIYLFSYHSIECSSTNSCCQLISLSINLRNWSYFELQLNWKRDTHISYCLWVPRFSFSSSWILWWAVSYLTCLFQVRKPARCRAYPLPAWNTVFTLSVRIFCLCGKSLILSAHGYCSVLFTITILWGVPLSQCVLSVSLCHPP